MSPRLFFCHWLAARRRSIGRLSCLESSNIRANLAHSFVADKKPLLV